MKKVIQSGWLIIPIFIFGCASYQVATEVQRGRIDLLTGKLDNALVRFERAADLDPHYVYNFTPFQQSVWTYLGRTYYQLDKLPDARRALEQAASEENNHSMAHLYLGLVLVRQGEREKGLGEIQSGFAGVHGWLEYVSSYTQFGIFWDPNRKIRREIEDSLAMISGKDIDWKKLVASGEWVGKAMENEIDSARFDERRERLQDGDSRRRRRGFSH
jgi:tetratricopeptide (TPR) repeat protein